MNIQYLDWNVWTTQLVCYARDWCLSSGILQCHRLLITIWFHYAQSHMIYQYCKYIWLMSCQLTLYWEMVSMCIYLFNKKKKNEYQISFSICQLCFIQMLFTSYFIDNDHLPNDMKYVFKQIIMIWMFSWSVIYLTWWDYQCMFSPTVMYFLLLNMCQIPW